MIIIAEVSELTRKIKLPTDRVLSVNGDYQVDGIAFKLPATYEGDFDFSTAAARVHWTGVDKVEHTNLLTEEDENGYPLWIMPSELTQGGHGVIEFAVSFVATDATAAITKRWISDPVSFRNRRTVNGSNEDEEAEEETTYDRLAGLVTTLTATAATINDVKAVISRITNSSPVVVAAVADLSGLDTTKYQFAYVRADGYLYCYDGAAWQQGIKYGSYELDTTLKESGKAADAAAVGAKVSAIKEDFISNSKAIARQAETTLDEDDVIGKTIAYFAPGTNSQNGITYSYDANTRSITAVGTATSFCFFNFCGGTSSVPSVFRKGSKYILSFGSTDENIKVQVTVNANGSQYQRITSGISPILFEIPSNATGIVVRTVNYAGDTVNGTISGITFYEIVRSTLKPTGDTTDRTSEILYTLTKCGSCHLAGGDYYISGFKMPDNTILTGEGDATRIYHTTGGAAIEMGARCSVRDLTLYGNTSDITLPSSDFEPEIGTTDFMTGATMSTGDGYVKYVPTSSVESGTYRMTVTASSNIGSDILYVKLFSTTTYNSASLLASMAISNGEESEINVTVDDTVKSIWVLAANTSAESSGYNVTVDSIAIHTITSLIGTKHGILLRGEDKEFGHISGCRIERFNGAGIIAYDTGTPVDNGFEIIGGYIRNCAVGVYSKRNAEFIKLIGVSMCRNWYGFLCRSGSNYAANCEFLKNIVNCQIDDEEGHNGGHAAITGSIFGHANDNTGYGLIIKGTGRMIMAGCNLYHGKLLFKNTDGNVMSGCGFGDNVAWEIEGGRSNMFIGCYIKSLSSTPITITNNTATKIINCYTRAGAEVTV